MALQTFASHPSLGGFDDEHHAYCQVLKEIVDNAIDARPTCVRVQISKEKEAFQVSVTDNGCGMAHIQACVDPFSHNKTEKETSGRYGMGLTLALLHTQQWYPSCACIRSATKHQAHWTTMKCIVHKESDNVTCEQVSKTRKLNSSESGTCVQWLLPSLKAWPLMAEYLARFQLVLACKLEIYHETPRLMRPLPLQPSLEAFSGCPCTHIVTETVKIPTEKDSHASLQVILAIVGSDEENGVGLKEDDNDDDGSSNAAAPMGVVRLINQTPLLDTPQGLLSCGLLHELQNLPLWKHHGLHIENKKGLFVKDLPSVAQVLPKLGLSPAKVRLGSMCLLVCHVQAKPEDLPLPTLAKGGFPLAHAGMKGALEEAMQKILQNLQEHDLVFSKKQLSCWQRKYTFIPASASSIARILERRQEHPADLKKYLEQGFLTSIEPHPNMATAEEQNFVQDEVIGGDNEEWLSDIADDGNDSHMATGSSQQEVDDEDFFDNW